MELKASQTTAEIRAAMMSINDLQLREAEDVFRLLQVHLEPLRFYLDFALANYHEPESEKSLEMPTTEYSK